MDTKIFERLLSSVKETNKIIKGEKEPSRKFIFEEPNPKDIRAKLSLTQEKFAELMNISVHTLRNWEQGRINPEGPAKVLLNIVKNYSEIILGKY